MPPLVIPAVFELNTNEFCIALLLSFLHVDKLGWRYFKKKCGHINRGFPLWFLLSSPPFHKYFFFWSISLLSISFGPSLFSFPLFLFFFSFSPLYSFVVFTMLLVFFLLILLFHLIIDPSIFIVIHPFSFLSPFYSLIQFSPFLNRLFFLVPSFLSWSSSIISYTCKIQV